MELGRSGGVQGDRMDRTKTVQQISARFGLTWHREVLFSTLSGKLTFQCSRNGPQNPPFVQGLSRTPLLFIPRYLTHIFSKIILQKDKISIIENLELQKPRFTNRSPGRYFLSL